MAERNAPVADFFSSLWPDPGQWPWDQPGRDFRMTPPVPRPGVTMDWLDKYWDGRGPGDYPRGLRRYPTGYGDERRSGPIQPVTNGDRSRADRNPRLWENYYRDNSGSGSGGGGNGGNGGGNGAGGRDRGQMSFREFIQYQDRQAQQVAAQAQRDQRQSVYDWIRSSFQQWGMPDGFADRVIDITRDARSPEQALLQIRDTQEYRQRFAGNIARQKAGLPMLSEDEYLGLERSYAEALQFYGVPGDAFGQDDYAKWISGDVSVAEVQARAEIAGTLAQRKDPQLWKELESRGITKGDAAAYLLNPDKALPAIQKKLSSAEIGVAAREAGMRFGNKFENMLVDKGVDAGQARQAFQAVAEDEADLDALAARYGEKEFGKKALAKGELGVGGVRAKKRRRDLASRERASFSGGGGGSTVFGNNSF